MKASRLKTALLGSGAAIALVAFGASAQADDLNSMRDQLQRMQERIAKMEAEQTKARRVAAAAAVEAGDKPKSWKLPGTNTSMSIGGYAQLDVSYDFGPSGRGVLSGSGPANAVSFAGLPPKGSAVARATNQNWNLSAFNSRIWIRTWTPTDWGELHTNFEMDFVSQARGDAFAGGNPNAAVATFNFQNALRVRQAYGALGPVLAGQTWTTWAPLWGYAEAIDAAGGSGVGVPSAARHGQIRYTHNFGGGWIGHIAVEQPIQSGGVIGNIGVPGQGAAGIPDFVIGGMYRSKWGIFSSHTVLGQVTRDGGGTAGAGGSGTVFRWGTNAAARVPVGKRATLTAVGYMGQNMGAYSALPNGFHNGRWQFSLGSGTMGTLKSIFQAGFQVGGQFKWTDTIRTNVAYSWTQQWVQNRKALIGANTPQMHWAVHANIIWNPVPQVDIGAQYLYGHSNRTNSANAYASRFQMLFRYSF